MTETTRRAPREDDTRRLLQSARDGDLESFGELYARLAPALHGWAALRIRPELRAHLDPQDVVQEVWYRAWRAIGRLDPQALPLRPWLFRVAKNVLLEAVRKLRQPGPRPLAGGGTTRLFALRNLPASATAVSRRLARDESLRRFVEHVAALDPEDRRLVLHVGLEGLTYRETAERLGLARDAVAKRWQRLRARLEQGALPRGLLD